MQIIDEGYTLTQIPGIEHIKVEPSERSEYGVHVEIKLQGVPPVSYGLTELDELVEALGQARGYAARMRREDV
jgi:hypothetical protein